MEKLQEALPRAHDTSVEPLNIFIKILISGDFPSD